MMAAGDPGAPRSLKRGPEMGLNVQGTVRRATWRRLDTVLDVQFSRAVPQKPADLPVNEVRAGCRGVVVGDDFLPSGVEHPDLKTVEVGLGDALLS